MASGRSFDNMSSAALPAAGDAPGLGPRAGLLSDIRRVNIARGWGDDLNSRFLGGLPLHHPRSRRAGMAREEAAVLVHDPRAPLAELLPRGLEIYLELVGPYVFLRRGSPPLHELLHPLLYTPLRVAKTLVISRYIHISSVNCDSTHRVRASAWIAHHNPICSKRSIRRPGA